MQLAGGVHQTSRTHTACTRCHFPAQSICDTNLLANRYSAACMHAIPHCVTGPHPPACKSRWLLMFCTSRWLLITSQGKSHAPQQHACSAAYLLTAASARYQQSSIIDQHAKAIGDGSAASASSNNLSYNLSSCPRSWMSEAAEDQYSPACSD